MLGTPARSAQKSKRSSAVAKKDARKPIAVTVLRKKKSGNTKIIESDSDDDDDDNFLTSCGKALDRNPLDI